MTVLRIRKKENNFVILDKTCLRQNNLSWQAKGLHAYLMGLKDDCPIQTSVLVKMATNGRDSLRAILNELKKAGYITTEQVRNETTGHFNGIEYIIHELPQPVLSGSIGLDLPEVETPFPVKDSGILPEANNPASGNPSPAKASAYINNDKDNKDQKLNNKTAAAIEHALAEKPEILKTLSAAAFSSSKNSLLENSGGHHQEQSAKLSKLEALDVVIGASLTAAQKNRIETVVIGLQQKIVIDDPHGLVQEIEHCLLSGNTFTGCGKDFVKKLNAVRSVVLKGEWQTPASLVIAKNDKQAVSLGFDSAKLQSAYAELKHFQRLLSNASTGAKVGLQGLINTAQLKVSSIEQEIKNKGVTIVFPSNVISLNPKIGTFI